MSSANATLALFGAVVALDVAGLVLDLWLYQRGLPTITDLAHASLLVGVPIILLQLVGAAALGLHFWK